MLRSQNINDLLYFSVVFITLFVALIGSMEKENDLESTKKW